MRCFILKIDGMQRSMSKGSAFIVLPAQHSLMQLLSKIEPCVFHGKPIGCGLFSQPQQQHAKHPSPDMSHPPAAVPKGLLVHGVTWLILKQAETNSLIDSIWKYIDRL